MPNWCSNTLTLTHEDPKEIARAAQAYKEGRFLQELVPNPTGEWDYDWSVNNWGTKWDVGGSYAGEAHIGEDGCVLIVNFDSAWAPPITAYNTMVELGFGVEAMYYEPGMAFAGVYTDGADDCYDYTNLNSRQIEDSLPKDLNDFFGISESVAEYEDEEPLT